jgi:hypothetical protein
MPSSRLGWISYALALLFVVLTTGCGPHRLPPVEAGWVYAFHFPALNHVELDYYIDRTTFRMDKTHRAFWLRARGMTNDGEEIDSTSWWVVDCSARQAGTLGGTWMSAGGQVGHVDGHQMAPVLPATLSEYVFGTVCGAPTAHEGGAAG